MSRINDQRFAGVLLRLLRLQCNWSQETLCHEICTVSYLSKIEQGKVDANEQLLLDLFDRLEVSGQESSEMTDLRDELYEGIFSTDHEYTAQKLESLEQNWDQLAIGPCYADFVVIRAFHHVQPEQVPKELIPLLEPRQQALLALLHD